MSAPEQNCPQCRTPLKPDANGGLCLRCLLAFGLKPDDAERGNDSEAVAPAVSPATMTDDFDRFRIIEKLGEGGCGVVYRAEQLAPVRREVALKVIKLGLDTASFIARFDAERQALAMMDHPGIARVFDAGASRQGRPFFVMELVAGERITDFCDRRQLTIPQRLELFARVCEAVQHAHQKGIIHRDLKPSNILVAEHDGVAHPKIIDFGIAKAVSRQRLADQTIYTAFDQFVGTPAYMSPEQAGATGESVDTRSDIYSLGVLLYELLTGRPPFAPERLREAAVDEIFRIIRDEDPARPSARLTTLSAPELSEISRRRFAAPPKLLRELRGDLDWIVMKALEKQPARRYETANALAIEIRRHLQDEPVQARPPTVAYRLGKTLRRHKLVFAASAAVILALVAGVIVSTWRYFKEHEARQQAMASEEKARTQAARAEQVARLLKDMLAGAGPSVALGRDPAMLREILDRAASRVSKDFQPMPEVEVELRETMGRAYYDLKLLDQSETMRRSALRLREAMHGTNNIAVAGSLMELATVLNTRAETKDLTEAETLLRRALNLRRAALGESNLLVADALHMLGWNLDAQRKIAEAETLYRSGLAVRRAMLPADAPGLVPSLHAVALVLLNGRDRLEEAETCIREAIRIQERSLPKEHPARNDSLGILAKVLTARGRLNEAEPIMREVIATHRKLFGSEHELLSGLLNHQAVVLSGLRKFAEAENAILEAIALQTKARGPDHPHLTGYHGFLFQVLYDQRKWPGAEAAAHEWLRLARGISPRPGHLMDALHCLGKTQVARGDWRAAETSLRECVELCARLHESPRPPGSTRCSGFRRMHGEALLKLGRHAEAEIVLLAAYSELNGQTDKWALIDLEKSIVHLTHLYETTGRAEEAAEWKKRLTTLQKTQASKPAASAAP